MLRRSISSLSILVLLTLGVNAQSKCECASDDGSNSATQSCPAGFVALCTCSAFGTNGQCSKQDDKPLEGLTRAGLVKVIESSDAQSLAKNLSVAFGKTIKFTPTVSKFVIDKKVAIRSTDSHWDLFNYLSTKGNLLINGSPLSYWTGMRDNLVAGGAFKVCTGKASAQSILNEINFYAGTRYKIIGGDRLIQKDDPIKGGSFAEFINNFTTSRAITISEN